MTIEFLAFILYLTRHFLRYNTYRHREPRSLGDLPKRTKAFVAVIVAGWIDPPRPLLRARTMARG